MLYDCLEEAQNRLLNTLVTYEGEPVWVHRIQSNGRGSFTIYCYRFPFDGEQSFSASAADPAFKHFQSPPLGFCNYFGMGPNTFWCERVSARQRRQGLSGETLRTKQVNTGGRVDFNLLYPTDAFLEMVKGDYPPFDEALGKLIPSSSIAVDREYALRMTKGGYIFLLYKKDEVGLILRDSLFIRQDRQYLLEAITEHRNLPNRIEVM